MKPMTLNTFIAAALVIAFSTGTAQANSMTPPKTFTLTGIVVHAGSRQPLAGVKVELYQPRLGQQFSWSERGEPVQSITTDNTGSFELNALYAGPASLVFTKYGYQSIRYDVDLTGHSGDISTDPIVMWRLNVSALPACGSLMQPGQTANVYIVCGSAR
jgi:hypothetical protein